jgi:sensor histidine kinase YesM
LRHFLRASFDQHERVLAPLEEELTIVRMYLDIEMLRFGSRLKVEEAIDPGLAKVLVPLFSLQPLVENALEHGLRSTPRPGRLGLVVRPAGRWLEMSVSDNGTGVPSAKVHQLFFAKRQRVHALTLLRRRLQGLFGRSFQLEVRSEIGEGTTVTIRIPFGKRFPLGLESAEAVSPDLHQWAPQ